MSNFRPIGKWVSVKTLGLNPKKAGVSGWVPLIESGTLYGTE